jgi:hypothetical protein
MLLGIVLLDSAAGSRHLVEGSWGQLMGMECGGGLDMADTAVVRG